MVVSVIPVYLAQRLSNDAAAGGRIEGHRGAPLAPEVAPQVRVAGAHHVSAPPMIVPSGLLHDPRADAL